MLIAHTEPLFFNSNILPLPDDSIQNKKISLNVWSFSLPINRKKKVFFTLSSENVTISISNLEVHTRYADSFIENSRLFI